MVRIQERSAPLESNQALERFLAGVERRALRMAEMATGNPDDALDLVQDAMLGLVRSYARRSEEEWPPLFHRILQSRIRDWYRRSRVRNRFRAWLKPWQTEDGDDQVEPIQNVADPRGTDIFNSVQQQDAVAELQRALRSLPLRQQQAFLLRNWEGLDVAQTAYAMACSEGSVKTHHSRAVHRLREMLKDHWP